MGGLETSATGILGEMSKPLSWSMPALKVCEKLKKLDAQICDLRFGMFKFISLKINIVSLKKSVLVKKKHTFITRTPYFLLETLLNVMIHLWTFF